MILSDRSLLFLYLVSSFHMYILVWLWLVLFIIAIICAIIVISLYNTLIHLQKTCDNTLVTIFSIWTKKTATINDEKVNELLSHCINAQTIESKVKSFNALIHYSQSVSSNDALWKKIKSIDSWLSTEKRFFTNTARELNDRLLTFPTSILGSIIGLKQLSLIDLNDEERKGILPEAKYL